MIRKFFDTGTGDESGNGGGTPQPTETITVGKTFTMGEMMEEEEKPEPANDEASDKPQEAAKPEAGQEPAQGAKPNDKPAEDIKPEPAKPEEVKPQELSLEEVLKGKDKKEVLKAVGVSEELFDLLDKAQSLEDLNQYLSIKTRNVDAIPDNEILRESLRKEYADLDEAKFEKVFNSEMKKYNLDSFDPDEKELGEIRLERDAAKVRAQLKSEQSEFKLPANTSAEAQQLEEIRQQRAKADEELATFKKEVAEHEASKRLLESKRLAFGDGYNFEVENPQQLIEGLVDTSKMFASCIKEDGTVDMEKALKISAYANDPDGVESALIAHGKSKGNQDLEDELINPSKREGAAPRPANETLGQAFGSRGVHTNLGSVLGG